MVGLTFSTGFPISDLYIVVMYACGTQVIRLGLGKKADVISHANSNSNKVKLT